MFEKKKLVFGFQRCFEHDNRLTLSDFAKLY
jgi:hypothetical protein